MSETSKLQKYLMWYKFKELFSNGINKSQIGISLGLPLKRAENHHDRDRRHIGKRVQDRLRW